MVEAVEPPQTTFCPLLTLGVVVQRWNPVKNLSSAEEYPYINFH
jgi:hypothetical protein